MLAALTLSALLASIIPQTPSRGVVVDSGGSPTYLLKQSFEGTGYDNSETWTTGAGSPDPDSTTSAYDGTDSLFTITTSSYIISPNFTAQDEIWAFGTLVTTTNATASGRWLVKIRDASNNTLGGINARTTGGGIRINHGSVNSSETTIIFSLNTRYFWWFQWVKGTGTDGVANLYVSTDETKPGSPQLTIATGTSTTDATHVLLGGDSASGNFAAYQDKFRLDDDVIGGNPE